MNRRLKRVYGKPDSNIRRAFLHLAAEAAVSLGVVLAVLAMRYTDWLWLAPVVRLRSLW